MIQDTRGVLVPAGRTRAVRAVLPRRGSVRRSLTAVVGLLIAGVLTGLVWWLLAPLARAQVVQGSVYLTGHQELQAAQDGWFAVVMGLLGVLAATAQAWRPGRREAAAALAGAAGTGMVAVIAWRTGVLLGPRSLADQLAAGAQHPLTPLALHAYGVLLVGPFLFLLTRFLAALFGSGTGRPDPR